MSNLLYPKELYLQTLSRLNKRHLGISKRHVILKKKQYLCTYVRQRLLLNKLKIKYCLDFLMTKQLYKMHSKLMLMLLKMERLKNKKLTTTY